MNASSGETPSVYLCVCVWRVWSIPAIKLPVTSKTNNVLLEVLSISDIWIVTWICSIEGFPSGGESALIQEMP